VSLLHTWIHAHRRCSRSHERTRTHVSECVLQSDCKLATHRNPELASSSAIPTLTWYEEDASILEAQKREAPTARVANVAMGFLKPSFQ